MRLSVAFHLNRKRSRRTKSLAHFHHSKTINQGKEKIYIDSIHIIISQELVWHGTHLRLKHQYQFPFSRISFHSYLFEISTISNLIRFYTTTRFINHTRFDPWMIFRHSSLYSLIHQSIHPFIYLLLINPSYTWINSSVLLGLSQN